MRHNLELGPLESERLVRQAVIARRVGVDLDTLKAWEAAGVMPRSIKIGPKNLSFYAASLIEPWLIQKLSAARGDNPE